MKLAIASAMIIATFLLMPTFSPVNAQSSDVRQMCRNKYGIDRKRVTTDGQRQEADKKVAACIRSGGKS